MKLKYRWGANVVIHLSLLLLSTSVLFAQEQNTDRDLLDAVRSSNVALVKKILHENAYANPNYKGPDGLTVLMVAVKSRNREIVNTVLQAGGTIDEKDRNGRSALVYAVETGDKGTIDLLISTYGANINLQDFNKETPLMFAIRKSSFSAVQALLEYQPNLEITNTNGETALMLAAVDGNPDIVRALLDAGARADVRNRRGRTAINMAKNRDIRQLLNDYARNTKRQYKADARNRRRNG